jgi:transposase
MLRTASIKLDVTPEQAGALVALQAAYAAACNRLVPMVQAHRCWNRVALHRQDLTHIRERIKAGKRIRTRLHRWAFRQLQTFIEYKARAVGIAVEYVNPAYTSQTCSACGALGERVRHRFECSCGLRAHADLNASRNLAQIGSGVPLARATVNTPDVGCVDCHASP